MMDGQSGTLEMAAQETRDGGSAETGERGRMQGEQGPGESQTGSGRGRRAHVIVLGNEKGGSGKTTSAMHVIAVLLQEGFRVASMDLDSRQRSLSRYVENRAAWSQSNGVRLAMPDHQVIELSQKETVAERQEDERERFQAGLARASAAHDFVVIDCPGSDSFLSRLGHAVADTLITPMNDSFVDFDLLARVDPQTYEIKGPSVYSEMVWESRKRRAMADGGSIDWVVMRNRLSMLDAKNKRRLEGVLETLADRIGFRLAPGFGERVIFREMFPSGLTLLDLKEGGAWSMSHVAARAEVRQLIETLDLPLTEMAGEG
ncbi:division plane positioning ATPase MipZ [Tepidicaulis sp.]|uniref:division plane positioning ATPase MipZ n=1 Tax=Tepidicaulis sp. TaxID=1920809 RepID=UPI003B5C8AB0